MGWERKRGKLEELNRLLRGATDTSFDVQVGRRRASSRSVRYCITLDSDTRLPRDAAKKLVGIIAHPLQPAALRPRASGRVTEGYGILQPRVSVTTVERRRLALRAHLRRAHRRRPLHDGRLGHLPGPLRRGHLHRQGALRRGRLHGGAGRARARQRAALPRPLRRPARPHRRSSPTSRWSTTIRRACSPTRGASTAGRAATGRSWPGSSRSCRRAPAWRGTACRSSRGGRSSTTCAAALLAPATVALLLARLDGAARQPSALDRGHPGRRSPSRSSRSSSMRSRAHARSSRGASSCASSRRTPRPALARILLQLTFLANQAPARMAHAIRRHPRPPLVTRRRLLEWETAAASAARGAGLDVGTGPRSFLRRRWRRARPSPSRSADPRRRLAPGRAPPRRRPCSSCGLIAPLVAYRLSQPIAPEDAELGPEDRHFLLERGANDLALLRDLHGTGRSRPAAGQLPGGPEPRIAHRTSPTNIGMGLLSTLAAHDLGIIQTGRAARADRRHPHHDGGPGADRGAPVQLVRHASASRRCRPGTSRPSTAATWPAP